MKLEGSCHCQAVRFTLESRHPAPFNLCYCTICRKTSGSGGYAINLGGDHDSLEVTGAENITIYQARIVDADGSERVSQARRSFCRVCGSSLWVWDPRWPELIHPQAGAIDTPLPVPPERTHLMLGSRANWAEPCLAAGDLEFEAYPEESISRWHERTGLTAD